MLIRSAVITAFLGITFAPDGTYACELSEQRTEFLDLSKKQLHQRLREVIEENGSLRKKRARDIAHLKKVTKKRDHEKSRHEHYKGKYDKLYQHYRTLHPHKKTHRILHDTKLPPKKRERARVIHEASIPPVPSYHNDLTIPAPVHNLERATHSSSADNQEETFFLLRQTFDHWTSHDR